MNALCYKIVFSKRLGALVAVGEHTAGQGKAAGTGVRTAVYPSSAVGATAGEFVGSLKAVFASVALTCFTATTIAAGPAANTLPTGYSVNSGNVAISTTGSTMNIHQATDKASVNWNSFSIGSGAAVNVQQNSASSVLLNRVVGNDPSQIFGKLTANGQVILINPNGVVFGKGGSVTASTFTASTFGMTDADFQAGKHKFSRNGTTAGVTVEEGAHIDTTGYVALIGASVDNQGAITTKGGSVVLASGEEVGLPSELTDNISVPLSGKVRLELLPSTINAMVANSGTITTDSGQVLMQAAAVSDAVASITHTGTIDTTDEQGGAVTLQADHGIIKATGKIKANSKNAKNKGADIVIGRDDKIDPITGKTTTVLAKATDASGAKLESQGGFVETSGDWLATYGTRVSAKDWLLDPVNITIAPSGAAGTAYGDSDGASAGVQYNPSTGSTILASDIAANLNAGTNVTISTGLPGSLGDDDGNINVNAAIVKSGSKDATLTLDANNRVIVNARIGQASNDETSTGNLDLNIVARGNAKSSAQGSVVMNNVIDAGNGEVNITATSQTGWEGLIFQGNSGITAGTYTVKGSSLSTAVRFNGGTATFNSSSGDSLIEGNGAGFGGVFASSGNTINLKTTGTATTTLASGESSAGGMRFGFGGGVTVNTNGNVTIGSHNNNAHLLVQANVNVNGGTLTLNGRSANEGILIQDASGVSHSIKVKNGSSLVMDGRSTGSNDASLGIRAINADHSIEMTGDAAGAKGSISMTGTSVSKIGIDTSRLTIKTDGGDISLNGTGGVRGLNLASVIEGGNINLKTDSLLINTGSASIKATGIDKGIVSINTTTPDKLVVLGSGASDTATQLGIDNGEIGKIAANKLVIGNADRTGNINVTGATTTNSDLELQTKGSIAINQALSVGTLGEKNLTLNVGGSIEQASTGVIKANKVDITGGKATVILDRALNEISRLAADVKSLRFQNGRALSVGDAAGPAATVVIKTADGARITTTTGNLTINQAIENTTSNDIVLGAGVSHIVNEGADSNVQTKEKATAQNLNANGKTLIYTGNANDAGKLSHLDSTLTNLDFSVIDTAIGQNADSKVAFNDGAGISGSKAKTQVMFRSQVAFVAPQGATLEKTYGDGTENTAAARAALLTAAKTKLKEENQGNSVRTIPVSTEDNTVKNTIRISNAALIDSLGDATLKDTVHSTSGHLKASDTTYKYGSLTSSKYTTTLAADKLEVKVNKADLTISGLVATHKEYDGNAIAQVDANNMTKTGLSEGDVVTRKSTSTGSFRKADNSADDKNVARAIDGTVQVKTVALTNEYEGADLGNYNLIDQTTTTAKITAKSLIVSGITAKNKVYDGNADALTDTANVSKTGVILGDEVIVNSVGKFRNATNTANDKNVALSNSGFETAKTVALTNTYTGADLGNYTISDQLTTTATITQKPLAANYLAKDKVFDGSTTADVIGTVTPISVDKVNVLHTSANFDSADIGTAKTVTVSGISLSGADAANYKVDSTVNAGNTAKTKASITAVPPKPPVPVVPTDGNSRVKIPVGSANPFALASAEDLADDTCSANSIENCHCEASPLDANVDICYEPKAGAKGSAH